MSYQKYFYDFFFGKSAFWKDFIRLIHQHGIYEIIVNLMLNYEITVVNKLRVWQFMKDNYATNNPSYYGMYFEI